MNLKRSLLAIQDEKSTDVASERDFPTIADLMREQNISSKEANTVHYRRDLDSIG